MRSEPYITMGDRLIADVETVQVALDRWNERPTPNLTLAESIVVALYANGRLS